VRDTTLGGGTRNYISGFEGSQAVSACPPGIGNSYDWNFVIYMTLEGLSRSPRYIAPARTAQKTSLPILHVLSLPGKQHVHRAVP
jgi:hypothetical protein